MAASSLFTSKLLNLRSSALHSLIRRHLLHSPTAAAAASKITLPFTSSQFLLRSGGAKSQVISSNAYLHSSIRFGAARSYVASGDRHIDADSDGAAGSDDEIDFDDLESFSGSEFDDEDEYEDPDDYPDAQ
ncbi:hypothetical protein SASPL_144329 [Salvia splendens]|uniref:Uncharacterized protein n=1 Tax=Salvia splendens TaxID=180675 RepID=A0A8X8WFH8_SALSN|nr:hypothetical protein SASPL_144329 [Salvia splendens]